VHYFKACLLHGQIEAFDMKHLRAGAPIISRRDLLYHLDLKSRSAMSLYFAFSWRSAPMMRRLWMDVRNRQPVSSIRLSAHPFSRRAGSCSERSSAAAVLGSARLANTAKRVRRRVAISRCRQRGANRVWAYDCANCQRLKCLTVIDHARVPGVRRGEEHSTFRAITIIGFL
jgi:hypothetical protein